MDTHRKCWFCEKTLNTAFQPSVKYKLHHKDPVKYFHPRCFVLWFMRHFKLVEL